MVHSITADGKHGRVARPCLGNPLDDRRSSPRVGREATINRGIAPIFRVFTFGRKAGFIEYDCPGRLRRKRGQFPPFSKPSRRNCLDSGARGRPLHRNGTSRMIPAGVRALSRSGCGRANEPRPDDVLAYTQARPGLPRPGVRGIQDLRGITRACSSRHALTLPAPGRAWQRHGRRILQGVTS